jgi:hypothetical protein
LPIFTWEIYEFVGIVDIMGNHDIKTTNRCLENVAQFRYLGTAVTNQNLIQEEIKRRLNLANACYHSVPNLLSSLLRSKNIKIKIYKSINFSCGSVLLRNLVCNIKGGTQTEGAEEKYFGPKRDEVTGDWRKLHNE